MIDISQEKPTILQATLEVARRLTLPSNQEKYTIGSPLDTATFVKAEMEHLDHEELRVLILDTKHRMAGNLLLYKGTIDSSVLRIAEIFRPAVSSKHRDYEIKTLAGILKTTSFASSLISTT